MRDRNRPARRSNVVSRGLGRIERAILALIEDKDAGKNGYAAENLAVAVYQWRKGKSGRRQRRSVLRWPELCDRLRTNITIESY
jgi:hypothetical protein